MGGGASFIKSAQPQVRRSRNRSSSLRHYMTSDLEIICFYPQLRGLFFKYLIPMGLDYYLSLYELINDIILHTEPKHVYSVVKSRMAALPQDRAKSLKLSGESVLKLQLLQQIQDFEPSSLKEFDSVKKDLESLLQPSLGSFLSSQLVEDALHFGSSAKGQNSKERLLIAIRNDLAAKIIAKMMHDLSYEVVRVSTGKDAMGELMSSGYSKALIGHDLSDINPMRLLQDYLRGEDICKRKIDNYARPTFVYLVYKDVGIVKELALKTGYHTALLIPFDEDEFKSIFPQKKISYPKLKLGSFGNPTTTGASRKSGENLW